MGYYQSFQFGNLIACDQTQVICTPTDSYDRIISKELKVLSCGAGGCADLVINDGTILCDLNTSWNCNLCGNDLPYRIPIGYNDYFQMQFQQPDPFNGLSFNHIYGIFGWGTVLDAFVKDCCTDEYILDGSGNPKSAQNYISGNYTLIGEYITTDWNGTQNLTNIQQFQFSSNAIFNDLAAQFQSECFYMEFRFYDTNGGYTTFYTEPYQFVGCKDTLYISGMYDLIDCYGYYHGMNFRYYPNISLPFIFNNARRFPASLERVGFSIEKEFVGNTFKTTSSSVTERFLLRTDRLPEKMAIYLVNLLASESVMIDGIEYVCDGEVNKNNEIGSQWFIEATLRKRDCNKKFGNCN